MAKTCSACGKGNDLNMEYCQYCGADLSGRAEETPKKTRKISKLEIGIIAAIVCIFIATALVVISVLPNIGGNAESADSVMEAGVTPAEGASEVIGTVPTATPAPISSEPVATPEITETHPEYETVEYPLTDDFGPVSMSVFYPYDDADNYYGLMSAYITESTEETGFEIDEESVKPDMYHDRFNLNMAAYDYFDIYLCFPYTSSVEYTGIYRAYEDEILVDLSDYLDEYAPDFMRLCADEDSNLPEEFYEDGKFLCFPTVDVEGNRLTGSDNCPWGMYITTSCQDIPAAVAWCNWWYTHKSDAGLGVTSSREKLMKRLQQLVYAMEE